MSDTGGIMTDDQRQPLRVSPREANERIDAGDGIVLDVVDTPTYRELSYRAEGAIRIAPENFEAEFERLPKDKSIFAY